MKLSLITKKEVKKLTKKELVSLHYRVHQLYTLAKKRNQKDFVKFLVNTHNTIVNELIRRDVKHKSPVIEMISMILQEQ